MGETMSENREERREQAKSAGAKGGSIRAAKKKAAETGEPVMLEEHSVVVHPDGRVLNTAPEEETEQASNIDFDNDPDFAEVEEITSERDLPTSLLGWANHFKEHNGLSDDDAMTMAQSRMGIAKPAAAGNTRPDMGTPVSPHEPTGPDEAMVDAYKERLANYVPPVLDATIIIREQGGATYEATFPLRFLDYLKRRAHWETARRRREMNPADCLQFLLRQAKAIDQDAALIMNPHAATGPAETFNATAGDWS